MSEILELKKEISELKGGLSKQTVSANINNPLVIAVLLISVLGYVYFDQQDSQDNSIQTNTALISTMQADQKEQTDSLLKLTSAVNQLLKEVERNTENIRTGTSDRFTNQDGSELRQSIQILQSKVDGISTEFATMKGKLQ